MYLATVWFSIETFFGKADKSCGRLMTLLKVDKTG